MADFRFKGVYGFLLWSQYERNKFECLNIKLIKLGQLKCLARIRPNQNLPDSMGSKFQQFQQVVIYTEHVI